ncbi:Asp23/Gls24 family envelope stress response protein [Gordonia sp. HY285]|uniref:Asp23/Gls24 family envelope stress response protein n=1 Tax=Gordonia liuliyuniae TaxID=2911517 RepID=A0ABS9ITY8_9ACTN|nr:Asp23/Gls24 family envelope stress response protein [Gordonia liuliyuniae]MCF8589028.1 Asp23/Gls24 family envelope stress response protein [Gordonia liuliyuniae]MCF8609102.1 Asp23/Gls24 family envelope stress response protein [Gordonia liuliyuniae]
MAEQTLAGDRVVEGGTAPASTREPGTLVIAERVVRKIAERAALSVDGVVRQQGTVGAVLGSSTTDLLGINSDLPQASVDAAGTARRLSLTVALEWPCAVTRVCRQVRTSVADELEQFTGDRPIRVDVTVRELVPRGEVSRRKQGYIDLPSITQAHERATASEDRHDSDD